MPVLHYGSASSITVELAGATPPGECGTPMGMPLGDPRTALKTALQSPLDYPPLGRTATPGDRVVIALGHGIPQVAQVTAAIVETLVEAGVEADGITVLRTEADVRHGAEDPCRMLTGDTAARVRLVTHDSLNRRGLGYLAASDRGDPIHLNRLLTDADVVLPVNCVRREGALGYFGAHTALYPEFSDEATLARYRRLDGTHAGGNQHRDLRHEVKHVAWLLGVAFSIQIVPGANGGILHAVCGATDAVETQGRQLFRAAWNFNLPQRTNLVVAALEGGAAEQTWENLGRALAAASRVAEEGGAIAVCTELDTSPGAAVQRLRGAASRESAVRQIRRDSPTDAIAALQIAHALGRHRIYLLSRLDPALVEELEMVHVAAADEVVRLAQRSRSCTLLAEASRAMVHVEND